MPRHKHVCAHSSGRAALLPFDLSLWAIAAAETFDLTGIAAGLVPGCLIRVTATAEDGKVTTFQAKARLDSEVDVA